ncbi:MAG: hypothetical protein ACO1SX_04600 [Actinomycetota bacterium]
MSEAAMKDELGQVHAPADLTDEDQAGPNAPPAGVRRNQQDTAPVDGERVLHPEPGEELMQKERLQG